MTSTPSRSGRSRSGPRPTRAREPLDVGYPVDEFDVDEMPGQRRGAHRTATPAVIEQLPFLVVALVAVVAVVAVFALLARGDDPGTAGPAAPAATEPAATAPAATEAPATSAPPATSSPAPTADRSVPLVVLNGTDTSGLASEVAAELEELGWTIDSVGNVEQKPVATTVVQYSDPALQVTAEAVAADLGVTAVLDEAAAGQVVVVIGTDR